MKWILFFGIFSEHAIVIDDFITKDGCMEAATQAVMYLEEGKAYKSEKIVQFVCIPALRSSEIKVVGAK